MSDATRERADRRLQEAMERTGARDPREFYRVRLRELKDSDSAAYDKAVRYFQETLVPTVADGDVDPLAAWTEYGRKLAELSVQGRTVSIDATGRAEPYTYPAAPDRLVLHLPNGPTGKALLVGLPGELSPAQRATYDWLVAGKQTLRG